MVCESESTTTSTPFASLLGGEVNIHLERRGGAVNIAKFEQLRAQGRMTPAGERAFASRTEGRSVIYAYEQQSTAELSPKEVRTFKRHKLAWRFFEATPPSYRKVILHWVITAKRAETRASRFAKLVEACAAGKRLR
jgi:uncharacterized protein YdeI (YjbR/CyaY-like superfamily)